MPVDSITTSMSILSHGNFDGFTCEKNLISFPLTSIPLFLLSTYPLNLPYIESYLRRCASISVLPRSFTAIISNLSPY